MVHHHCHHCADCGGCGKVGGKWFLFFQSGGTTCPRCKGDGQNHPPYNPELEVQKARWNQLYYDLYGPYPPAPPKGNEDGNDYFLRTGRLSQKHNDTPESYLQRYLIESARRDKLLKKRRKAKELKFSKGK